MKPFFLLLILFLLHLKSEALQYSIFDNVSLEDHKNSTEISTEFLDTFTEDGLPSICIVTYGETTGWFDWFNQWRYDLKDGGGTAFFITPEGHLITNKHVSEFRSNFVIFPYVTDHLMKASLIAEHPTEDIALLKIDKPHDVNFSYLRISSNKEEVGNWIFSFRGRGIVNNSKLLILPSIGKLLGYNESGAYAISSIAVTEGNSGSPVLNFEGKVIGIITQKAGVEGFDGEIGMSAMLSMHKLKDWIEEVLRFDEYFEQLE